MRHRVAGKQLSRTTSHRKAMRRNMAASLFEHGAIRTTEVKAKELRSFAEKLITIAKQGTLHARRQVIQMLRDRDIYAVDPKTQDSDPTEQTVVQKLFSEIAPRYAQRQGGYTRLVRIADRRIGDGGVQMIVQLVEEGAKREKNTANTKRRARVSKLYAAADVAVAGKTSAAPAKAAEEAPEKTAE
ncbi:MAG TPA: 50S ribosomal protein L17 [Phycisphaerae bacterium]|nr:50S ribosomal protein L17 [Phycisphaerae bacterium]HPS53371.1 50S ribosomal protein L17 [Phycisphaerae bacterium]